MGSRTPIPGDSFHVRRVDIDEVAVAGVDTSIFKDTGHLFQDTRMGIEIIRIENADNIPVAREIPLFIAS